MSWKKMLLGKLLAVVVMAAAVVGCDVQTYDDAASSFNNQSPPPPAPPPPPGPPPPPSPPPPPPPIGFNAVFSEIQSQVFTPLCQSCHSGGGAAAGLSLDAANSYTMLVGIDSTQMPGTQRVNPGNPNLSYLITKLEGAGATGVQMPPGNPMAQADIDTIRQWIQDGALDDRAAPGAVRVASLTPAPNAIVTVAPNQIVAGFDREVNAASVDTNTFIVEASTDGTCGNGDDVVVNGTVAVPGANPASAIFTPAAALANETYCVRLLGDGVMVISDLDGNALDGEFPGTLPSGDGNAGGDFIVDFTVAVPSAFDMIQTNIFNLNCRSCHSGAVPSGGLGLDNADTSYANLVNQPSNGNMGVDRVEPFMPDNSYLIQKMEGNAGTVMPPSGMLPQATIDTIRDWITQGAER